MTKPIIVKRATKGTPLTYTELDSNFQNIVDATVSIGGDTGTVTNDLNGSMTIAGGTGLTTSVAGSTLTVNLDNTAVTAGAYTNANITVDAQGRITLAANGTAGGGGTVTGTGRDHYLAVWTEPGDPYGTGATEITNHPYLFWSDYGLVWGGGSGTSNKNFEVSISGGLNDAYLVSKSGFYSVFENNNTDSQLVLRGYGNKGGTGYHDFLHVANIYGSATNPDKWFRLTSTGTLEIRNSAYTTTIFSLTDAGVVNISSDLTVAGSITSSTNNSIVIAPDGTGDVHLNTDSVRIGDNNSDATLATRGTGDLILTTHEGSGTEGVIRIYDGANSNITLAPNGTGKTVIGNLVATETIVANGNTGAATLTPNAALGAVQSYTVTGNITFSAFDTPIAGQSITVILTQDATGSRLLTSTMKFAGGSKTLSTAANAVDIISVYYDGTNYWASLSKGFA